MTETVIWLDRIGMNDVHEVGGKNASLGEMISNLSMVGVKVPEGFATTADAYRTFLHQNGLAERIKDKLAALDINDVTALASAGAEIRQWIIDTPFHEDLQNAR